MKQMNSFGGSTDGGKREGERTKKQTPVFGIDLGTTNCAISVIQDGTMPVSIPLGSRYTMPSCVMWHHCKFIVGLEAYEHREQENVAYSVKRLMQDADATVTFIDGNDRLEITPAEVSAEILKGLVKQTEGLYGEIKDVVVTVPAYFNQIGRDNTRKACEYAGLNPVAVINEPTAASLNYDLEDGDDGSTEIVCYDLGGGTFDVTVAKITNTATAKSLDDFYGLSGSSGSDGDESGRSLTVLATAGNPRLGGDDLDLLMYEILCGKLRDTGVDTSKFSERCKEELLIRLERMKKTDVTATFRVPVTTLGTDGRMIEGTATIIPDDFEQATRLIYKKTKRLLDKVLRETNTKAKNLVLVGGSTKNVWLQQMLRNDYPHLKLNNTLDPDLSVACGAAIHGKSVKYGDANVTVFDVLPISLRVLDGGKALPIIKSGECLPVSVSKLFTTVHDNQETLDVQILQGESTHVDECVSLGTLTITGIKHRPAGEPNLVVSITVSADSVMTCEASVDGQHQSLTLNLAGESGTTVTLTRAEKSIKRWRAVVAENSSSPLAAELSDAIDAFEKDASAENKAAVLALVREISSSEG